MGHQYYKWFPYRMDNEYIYLKRMTPKGNEYKKKKRGSKRHFHSRKH